MGDISKLNVGGTLYDIKDAKARTDVSDLKEDFKDEINLIVSSFDTIEPYLYKTGAYINYSTGVVTEVSGYNIYKIPVTVLDVLGFTWSENYAPDLGVSYQMVAEFSNNTFETVLGGKPYGRKENGESVALVVGVSNLTNIYLNVKSGKESAINMAINKPYVILSNEIITSKYVKNTNTLVNQVYLGTSGFAGQFTYPYQNFYIKASVGDIVRFNKTVSGMAGRGAYITADGTCARINNEEFVAPEDCVICIYDHATTAGSYTYIPSNSIKIASKDIIGDTGNTQFSGLNGVAFGTSLTSRAISDYGFLDYLPELSGITFDNQGIASSYILGNMLTAIKNYTSYSDKRICLIEGFVNDWYYNKTLGTWEDTTEDTVCGCVRSAINYIMMHNANIALFLILDHYGRNHSSLNCSTTAENSGGMTQYEYYEEIAKVAESLGIPVIKEYEVSQISENTPQYLADNIHLNDLGAKQSAYAIWSQLKQYYPNQI